MTGPTTLEHSLIGSLSGTREFGPQEMVGRYAATLAFVSAWRDPGVLRELLGVAALEMWTGHAVFSDGHDTCARIALLGVPHQAPEIAVRVATGLPPRPTAEAVTTHNLAVLIGGSTSGLLSVPGRRTDVARAILARDMASLRRLVGADVRKVHEWGFYDQSDPAQWYPVFAALISMAARRHGVEIDFTPPMPPRTGGVRSSPR